MRRIGLEMVARKKAQAEQSEDTGAQVIEKDLLSLLIRSNLKENMEEKLDDETLLAQIGTVIGAGHETTAVSVSCTLYALARDPSIQAKLRSEVLACEADVPSMEELVALPYLDTVVKESLRLYAPITAVYRDALQDGMIPLGTPVLDKNGKEIHEILYVPLNKVIYRILTAMRLCSASKPGRH